MGGAGAGGEGRCLMPGRFMVRAVGRPWGDLPMTGGLGWVTKGLRADHVRGFSMKMLVAFGL